MAALDRNRMLTLEEAAGFLSLSTRTLRREIKSRKLVAHKFGRLWRIAEKDLLAFIEGHRNS